MNCALPLSGVDVAPRPRGSRRRRLWELPAQAHELLLGLALPPELLRHTLQQALGRQRAARCVLGGSDVDLLFSAVHDMGTRNMLSQAVHKLLDTRHALAVRQLAALREPDALQAALVAALDDTARTHEVPALLWAVLTHACGGEVQDAALFDVRGWLYRRQRAAQAETGALQALRLERDRLAAELNDARSSAMAAHTREQARALADAAALARLRGELARAASPGEPRPAPSPSPLRMQRPIATAAPAAAPRPAEVAAPAVVPEAPPSMPPIAGRKVLCVGGINGAVDRYRALVEARGGRFSHHDGGIEHNLQRLHAQLASADLVLCQAGCVNHEAYRCVKRHCKRFGTACVFIERPSLSRFERELRAPA